MGNWKVNSKAGSDTQTSRNSRRTLETEILLVPLNYKSLHLPKTIREVSMEISKKV